MEPPTNEVPAPLDDDLHSADISRARATRFYDRIRGSIGSYVGKKGGAVEKTAGYLLLAPDVFILLWRLVNDSRVSRRDKVLLGSALVYFISPFDLIPEAIVGPIGYLDDLVFAVYTLNKVLTTTSASVVREHWSGSEDVLAMIQRVLGAADSLIGSEMFHKVKKLARRE